VSSLVFVAVELEKWRVRSRERRSNREQGTGQELGLE
jgi:hypothetical protein